MLRVAEHVERTDTGRARSANEDSYFARSPLFAIADGMGGAQAGEVASTVAVEVLEQGLPTDGGSVEERLARRVSEANARINDLSRSDQELAGMGTTLTAVYVGEHEITIAPVGDSRLYRLRDGVLERLTEDHTLVEELVRQGKLTPEEAGAHPQRSIITRALGPELGVRPDTHTSPARAGDVYLICSDGLTSMVAEDHVARLVGGDRPLTDVARALVDAANAAGGRDNITVVLFRLEEVPTAGAASTEQPTSTGEAVAADVGPAAAATATSDRPPSAAVHEVWRPSDAPIEPTGVVPRTPLPPRMADGPAAQDGGRRRRLRVPVGLVLATFLVGCVLVGFYFASQTVYFVGTSRDGFVTVFRGLPYELPAGLDLYSVNYESGVPAASLAARQRDTVTGHKLRSKGDAQDYVRRLEQGRVQP
jgi:PPM family protein phosphatase